MTMSFSMLLPSGCRTSLHIAMVITLLLTPNQIGKQDSGSGCADGSLGRRLPALFAAAQPSSGKQPPPPPPPKPAKTDYPPPAPPPPPPGGILPKQVRDSQAADGAFPGITLTGAVPAPAPAPAAEPFVLRIPPLSAIKFPALAIPGTAAPVPPKPAPKRTAAPTPAPVAKTTPGGAIGELGLAAPAPAPEPAPAAVPKQPAAAKVPAPQPEPLPAPAPEPVAAPAETTPATPSALQTLQSLLAPAPEPAVAQLVPASVVQAKTPVKTPIKRSPPPKLQAPTPAPAPAPAPVPKLAPAKRVVPTPEPVPAPAPKAAAAVAPAPEPATAVTPAPEPAAAPSPSAGIFGPVAKSSIIRAVGPHFAADDCSEYFYTGWNSYNELVLAGTTKPAPLSLNSAQAFLEAQDDVATRRFVEAKRYGLSVFRVFATGGEISGFVLQPGPGRYNETVFRAIDYMLAQAGNYGLKAVLSIIDNWQVPDNRGVYLQWAGLDPVGDADMFWTSPRVKQLYMNHVRVLFNRRNVYTGRLYKNDPAIFSWNLYNEPRNPYSQKGPGKPGPVTAWTNQMAAFAKSIDPNHLVTLGEEGFFAQGSHYTQYNPFGTPGNVLPGWSERIGQDFVPQSSSSNIDYAAIHLWPDNWNTTEVRLVPLWLGGHVRAMRERVPGKPLVLEEFGKVGSAVPIPDKFYYNVLVDGQTANRLKRDRDPYYRAVYDAVEASIASGGPLRSALFWEWLFPGEARTERGVETNDTAFQDIVFPHAQYLKSRPRTVVPGCVPRGSPSVRPAAPVTADSIGAAAG